MNANNSPDHWKTSIDYNFYKTGKIPGFTKVKSNEFFFEADE
jgi:hypothetical protein